MKRELTCAIAILICLGAEAQYLPNSCQAFQFASVYNPAFTGVEVYGDLKLGYRHQWTGFGANAPKFANLVYNTRLKQPVDLNRNSLRTSIPLDAKLPVGNRLIHGIGASVFNEDVGAMNRLGGSFNYSFHIPLSGRIWMATGLSVGIENTRVDIDKIYLGADPDPDPLYDGLLSNGAKRTYLNGRAGVLFYSPVFYVGICYLPIWNAALQNSEDELAGPLYRGTAQTGVSIPFGETFSLKPGVLGVLQMDNKLLVDYSLKVFYQERIWLGVTYRSTKSGVGLVGLNLNKLLVAAYSYEVPVSAARQFSDGSHELVLAIRFNNSRGYNPYTW